VRIIAFDAATDTGWGISDGDRLIEFGTQRFDLRRGESPGLRFLRFGAWLEDLWKLAGPFDLARYERAHHRGGAATELCVGFVTRIIEWAAKHGMEYEGVPSSTLKKAIAGKGNADKEDVKAAVCVYWDSELTRLKRSPANFDESDALALLAYRGS
jgi:crossover junction endodeoxyribonuclease RuvC